jgi:hypothetical protein
LTRRANQRHSFIIAQSVKRPWARNGAPFEDPRIIVASPCSGHGAKFASAIGAMVADGPERHRRFYLAVLPVEICAQLSVGNVAYCR